ncbi:MAG: hypothetical protein FWH11_01475 [Micrococcales bacterium]|nr:hypothetical protein [Micrococcales bacterium]
MHRYMITLRDGLGTVVATGDRVEVDGSGTLTVALGDEETASLGRHGWLAVGQFDGAGHCDEVAAPAVRCRLCEECAAGDHSSHQAHLAGICIGCGCTWRQADAPRGGHAADEPETPAFVETVEALGGAR